MSTVSIWAKSGAAPKKPHVVAAIKFSKGVSVDASPLDCVCGWTGTVGEWPAHFPRAAVSRAWSEDAPAPQKLVTKPECINGHPYTDSNTYLTRKGSYSCKVCRKVSARTHYATHYEGPKLRMPGTRILAA